MMFKIRQVLWINLIITLDEVNIIPEKEELVALIATTDFPLASKNVNKQMLLAASIYTSEKKEDKDRINALHEAGVDFVVLDYIFQIYMIRWIKEMYPDFQVLNLNVVNFEEFFALYLIAKTKV